MQTLRIRVELNKGRKGIPIHKLSALTQEIERFFVRVGSDLGIQTQREGWLAVRFSDGSVAFDAEYQGQITEETIGQYQSELARLPNFAVGPQLASRLSRSTLLQFAKIGDPIDQDERVSFGLYGNGAANPTEWHDFDKVTCQRIAENIVTTSEYRGLVQGVIHSWFKETSPAYFYIQNAAASRTATSRMVKCIYRRDQYPEVAKLLQKKTAVVQVIGMITANFIDRRVEEVRAERFAIAEELSDQDFEKFFGMAPDLTGGLTIEEYVASVREYVE